MKVSVNRSGTIQIQPENDLEEWLINQKFSSRTDSGGITSNVDGKGTSIYHYSTLNLYVKPPGVDDPLPIIPTPAAPIDKIECGCCIDCPECICHTPLDELGR